MKISDLKHNHSLTDLLKVSLFSILMLAPVLSVGVRSLYVICNKNANQSYSDSQIATISQITNTNNLADGLTYKAVYQEEQGTNYSGLLGVKSLSFNPLDYNYSRTDVIAFQSSYYGNNLTLKFADNSTETKNVLATLQQFNFVYDSNNTSGGINLTTSQLWFYYESYTTNPLDNVFNYSVEKLANDDLFSWTQETAIFTGVKAMTDQLEVNTLAIPVILTYWFLLTVIYVIIDIILKCFTVLTHMIGSKTA